MTPIERFQLTLRPRTAWESLDLGIVFARKGYRSLLAVWLIASLFPSLFIIVLLRDRTLPFLLGDRIIQLPISFFVIWWIKPLFKRALLGSLKRQLFSEPPITLELWKEWLLGLMKWGVGDLLWRRLNPSRSFLQPIVQFEQNSQSKNRLRERLLRRRYARLSDWNSIAFSLFEGVAFGSVVLGVMMLLSFFGERAVDTVWSHPALISWGVVLLYYLVITLLTPFYVSCGLTLYLHARIEIEAWDIQLRLMKLVRRVRSVSQLALLLFLFTSAALCWMPEAAFAQVRAEESELQEESREREKDDLRCTRFAQRIALPAETEEKRKLQEILKNDQFDPCHAERRWVRRANRSDARWPRWLLRWFDSIAEGMSQMESPHVEAPIKTSRLTNWLRDGVILTFLGVTLLSTLYLLYFLSKKVKPYRAEWKRIRGLKRLRKKEKKSASRERVIGNERGEIEQLARAGEIRAALALLYQSLLSDLNQRFELEIPNSATESELLRLIEPRLASEWALFSSTLMAQWQVVAYGGASMEISEVIAMNREWSALHNSEKRSGEVR